MCMIIDMTIQRVTVDGSGTRYTGYYYGNEDRFTCLVHGSEALFIANQHYTQHYIEGFIAGADFGSVEVTIEQPLYRDAPYLYDDCKVKWLEYMSKANEANFNG